MQTIHFSDEKTTETIFTTDTSILIIIPIKGDMVFINDKCYRVGFVNHIPQNQQIYINLEKY